MMGFLKRRPSGPERTPLEFRFWTHVRKTAGCWEWQASVHPRGGYGQLGEGGRGGRNLLAHRVSWEIHNGPIPDGLLVLHKCDNRRCVRPDHLFLGTYADNTQDAVAKGRMLVGDLNPNRRNRKAGTDNHQARLTDDDVRAIRRRWRNGESAARISQDYPVSDTVVRLIVRGLRWSHVPDLDP
jgi:hypothetical protein